MSFKWTLKNIKVKDIKLNPDNPKVRNERGFERLRKSLEKFGHIFDGIINTDNSLIDGHSRIELMKPNDTARLFMPDKKLTKKQYQELTSIFDIATAGDPDWELIIDTLGEDGAEEWGIESDNTDYSDRNKELEINQISDDMILTMKFPEKTFFKVIKELNKNGDSFEEGLLNILGI